MATEKDTFPYKRYSMPDSPAIYFRRAQAYRSSIEERVLRTLADEARLLRPDSVVSATSRRAFLEHFPLHYLTPARQPRRALVIRVPRNAYNMINVLPDYYTEDARIRDTGAFATMSPYEYWNLHKQEIIEQAGDSQHEQRELLWKIGPKEPRQSQITDYLSLFALLKSKIVLDPSAAWGDRLIAALASPTVEAYTGVDPHSRTARGWQEILDELGPLSGKADYRERFVMLNEPFEPEDATPLPEGMGNYDTVVVSTAPLVGDRYDTSNPQQAANKHGSSLASYVKGFLIPYLSRCISALKVGGYLCITVLDRASSSYHITELKLLLVELLMGRVMRYRGAIWWELNSGRLVPWWIFIKGDSPIPQSRQEEAERLLKASKEKLGLSSI